MFYKEGDHLVAHCLEFDLIGHGNSQEDAVRSLCTAISMQIEEVLESGNIGNLFSPAPGEFFRMFAAGKADERTGKAVGSLKIEHADIDVSDVDARYYADNDHHEGELALA